MVIIARLIVSKFEWDANKSSGSPIVHFPIKERVPYLGLITKRWKRTTSSSNLTAPFGNSSGEKSSGARNPFFSDKKSIINTVSSGEYFVAFYRVAVG